MNIVDYEYSDADWHFNKVKFKNINLIVGDSGSGKTRLLNSIFNLGSHVAQKTIAGENERTITLGINNIKYQWIVSTHKEGDIFEVKNEELLRNGKLILSRSKDSFSFEPAFPSLPKLPRDQFSISILQEEEVIHPIYEGFSKILRRNFFGDELERNSGFFYAVNNSRIKKIIESQDLYELYKANLPLNSRLLILRDHFHNIYKNIVNLYKESFGFIEKIELLDSNNFELGGRNQIFSIKEKRIDKWIGLHELSSGMQKTLLIITDLYSIPSGSIYFIDEYENSLGVGAINVLPDAISSGEFDLQIFVTSHHPYIISKFPIENWYVVHRSGKEVTFNYGEELIKRYSTSSQDKYIQLLNDPYYERGIE